MVVFDVEGDVIFVDVNGAVIVVVVDVDTVFVDVDTVFVVVDVVCVDVDGDDVFLVVDTVYDLVFASDGTSHDTPTSP